MNCRIKFDRPLCMSIEIQETEEEKKYCVEFRRLCGNTEFFYKLYHKMINGDLGDAINAQYSL